MTQEQYEHWSAPFRKSPAGTRFIVGADRILTFLIFAAYPVLLFYLLYAGRWEELLSCIVIPAVSFLLVSAFRRVYSAPRPYELLSIQPLIIKETKGKSFPSRHVFSVFMIGMTYFYVERPVGILIGIAGLLMGYIRVVSGVHFPKDVAAGAVLGILCGLMYYIW